MAVIYADLRFTRTTFPPQTEAAPELPGDDWEVTYENVTPGGGKKGGAEGSPTRTTEPTGVLARFPPHCVPITASVVVLVFLAVVITLATQLYRINHQHDETRKSLEELLQEHGLLNSTLTKNILTKESEARKVQETLRQTQMRLDDTRKDLQRGQDEAKTSQRRLQEKEGMEATMRQLREDLTKCKGDQNWATSKAEQSVATLRGSLARSEASLKTKTETLSAKEKEISSMKKTIQQTEDRLRWNQQQLQNLKESQSKTEAELSEMRNSMQQVQDELLESQRTSQLQLKKLSDAEQCFLNSCHNDDDEGDDKGGEEEEEDDPDSGGDETYCPAGWKQIDQRCYYFSDRSKVRVEAEEDCHNRGAKLAKLSSSDNIPKELIRKDGGSFWIGLKKEDGVWKWPDGTKPENFKYRPNVSCAKLSSALESQRCDTKLAWICQKRSHRCRMGMKELRCFREKTGVFGEKIGEWETK